MNYSEIPLIFDNDRITRPYIGGVLLNQWRRMDPVEDSHDCEELLVSSIGAIADGKPEGYAISKTIPEQGSVSLKNIIEENPVGVLGKKYHDILPNHLKVLARAGDTIVRLVLQCHPMKDDAVKYFDEVSGKTEAWYIARTREVKGEINCVYAGFKKHVTKEYWKELVKKQDIEKMVECLHKIPVKQGDVVLIPAGMPHAVGPGVIFLEIHECSDVTIRVERNINGMVLSDKQMFNGLNMDTGLELFDYTTYTDEEIRDCVVMTEKKIDIQGESRSCYRIDESNTNAFYMQVVDVNKVYKMPLFDGHRIMIPTDGDITLSCQGGEFHVTQGWGVLIPANCKDLKILAENARVVVGIPSL